MFRQYLISTVAVALIGSSLAAAAPRTPSFDGYIHAVAEKQGRSDDDVRTEAMDALRKAGKFSDAELERIGHGKVADKASLDEIFGLLDHSSEFHPGAGLMALRNASIAKDAGAAFDAQAKQGSDSAKILNDIAGAADVGNGDSDVKTYDVDSFDPAKELQKLQAVKKDYKGCGPWGLITTRRASIDKVRTLANDKPTADALTKLYQEKKISKIFSLKTNNSIDCSRLWVKVFMNDGNVLNLYYGMND